jgi:hypothetical protein
MRWIKILFRIFYLLIVVSLPFLIVGYIFSGVLGAVIGLTLILIGTLILAGCSEPLLAHYFAASAVLPKGLNLTKDHPKILIFTDPFPTAIVARSLGGQGTIILSQGLFALLKEPELLEAIAMCQLRLKDQGLVFQSLCTVYSLIVLKLVPNSWAKLIFIGRLSDQNLEPELNPISTLSFMILYPWMRFFGRIGNLPHQSRNCEAVLLESPWAKRFGGAVSLLTSRKDRGVSTLCVIP